VADTFEKRVSLRMNPEDYERVEQLAREHARKPAEILRAAIVLGAEVIEKQGDKAIKRALGAGGEA
jgi:predicted DNA-binding protein